MQIHKNLFIETYTLLHAAGTEPIVDIEMEANGHHETLISYTVVMVQPQKFGIGLVLCILALQQIENIVQHQ